MQNTLQIQMVLANKFDVYFNLPIDTYFLVMLATGVLHTVTVH